LASSLEEIVEELEAFDYVQTYRKLDLVKPYAKQKLFFDLGATKRERMLGAGNQQGKCTGYSSLIEHPDGSKTCAGDLYWRGTPFQVMAWNGRKCVPRTVTHCIMKPPEPLVRLWLSSGDWFDCALNHRVLCDDGWHYVGRLLECVPSLPPSKPARDQSIRLSSARRWRKRVAGWLARCCSGFHSCDARLLPASVCDLDAPTSRDDALRRSYVLCGLDAQARTQTSSSDLFLIAGYGLPSSWYARCRCAVQSAVFLVRAAYRTAPHTTRSRQTVQRLSTAARVLFRSLVGAFQGRSAALVSPGTAGNKIVCYQQIGIQEVYDFTVPGLENYVTAGMVHHNTWGGAVETAYHLTGLYPPWWAGRRFHKPVSAWCAGVTGTLVRDGPQKLLCGKAGVTDEWGTGLIPKSLLLDKSTARGVTDAIDTLQIKHVSGGISTLVFKSYEAGREKFQSATLDFIWLDEEPPIEIYTECLARFAATAGMLYMTFTPLKGRSNVVLRFMEEPSADRDFVIMTILDAEHIKPEDRQKIIDSYPVHEREARVNGVPMMGSGRIFTVSEEMIREPLIERIPSHWTKLWSIDFGIGHPFAAVLMLWDKDNDVLHVHHCFKMADGLPINHAAAMKPLGANVPVAWPHDGTQREKGTGESLSSLYKKQGLRTLGEHATWPDGGISTEAGILEMQERMSTGRLKVASHLSEWFEEFRFYHRKDGLIVRVRDDIMSATRIGVMAKRYGQPVALGSELRKRRQDVLATGLDFPLF